MLQLAEDAVRKQPKRTAFLFAHGAALYRAGRPKDAVLRLQESLQMEAKWEGHCNTWLLLALAHHALGDAREARRNYDLAAAWRTKRLAKSPPKVDVPPSATLHTSLTFEQLWREAEAVFARKEGPSR